MVYWYESLSGFLIVLPYFVFTQLSPCCILLLSSLVLFTVLCICSCLLSCADYFLFVVHHVYFEFYWYCSGWSCLNMTLDCFWCVPEIAFNGSVCLYSMFCGLVAYVIICCYWCWPGMLSVACDSSTICCNLFGVWLIVVIVVSLSNNHPMGPWSTVFSVEPLQLTLWE